MLYSAVALKGQNAQYPPSTGGVNKNQSPKYCLTCAQCFRQESPRQTKQKFMTFAHFCEFGRFSLGKQARFTSNFCSGMPLGKVRELAFLWFGLPGRLLIPISDFFLHPTHGMVHRIQPFPGLHPLNLPAQGQRVNNRLAEDLCTEQPHFHQHGPSAPKLNSEDDPLKNPPPPPSSLLPPPPPSSLLFLLPPSSLSFLLLTSSFILPPSVSPILSFAERKFHSPRAPPLRSLEKGDKLKRQRSNSNLLASL